MKRFNFALLMMIFVLVFFVACSNESNYNFNKPNLDEEFVEQDENAKDKNNEFESDNEVTDGEISLEQDTENNEVENSISFEEITSDEIKEIIAPYIDAYQMHDSAGNFKDLIIKSGKVYPAKIYVDGSATVVRNADENEYYPSSCELISNFQSIKELDDAYRNWASEYFDFESEVFSQSGYLVDSTLLIEEDDELYYLYRASGSYGYYYKADTASILEVSENKLIVQLVGEGYPVEEYVNFNFTFVIKNNKILLSNVEYVK